MVIVYKVFPPYFPIHWVINIPWIGLPNIVAGKAIIKELLQQHANAEEISLEIEHILTAKKYRENIQLELQQIKTKLTTTEAKDLTQLVLSSLNKSHKS
jgi:lipid-A-disaccharide synthase